MRYWIFGVSLLVVLLMGVLAGVTIKHYEILPVSLLVFIVTAILFFLAAAFLALSHSGRSIFFHE